MSFHDYLDLIGAIQSRNMISVLPPVHDVLSNHPSEVSIYGKLTAIPGILPSSSMIAIFDEAVTMVITTTTM